MVGNRILPNLNFCHGYGRPESFEIELFWLGSKLPLNKLSVSGFSSHAHELHRCVSGWTTGSTWLSMINVSQVSLDLEMLAALYFPQVSALFSPMAFYFINISMCYYRCTCMLSHFSCVWLFATLWTVARQAPLAVELSRQEYWSWLLISISLISES